mgnify:FL=1
MPNFKVDYENKLKAVLEYLDGNTSQTIMAKKYGVSIASFQTWIRKYKSEGEDGLKPYTTYKKYSKETKYSAVLDYLNGTTSQEEICKKYRISSKVQLQRWILWYNGHKELKDTRSGGNKLMTKARKTTFDERIEIVKFCIANDKNYALTMSQYNVSYQQIYLWVRKYEQKGIDGLIDGRGKAKAESDLTEIDRLKAKNQILEAEKKRLEMEINVLKKLQEVERRRR